MRRRAKLGILIAMLVLSVGFAAITTTLVVNGTLSIGPDGGGFDTDVIFTKAKTTGNAYISSDGKSITFNADLMDIGQEQDLKYEITNKSRQYDATGTIECGFVDENNKFNDYITVTPTPEEFSVPASRKTTGHVTLRMVQSFIGDGDNDFANIEFKCTIKMEAGERDDLAPETPEVYKDEILNGTDPVLTGGLVPITLTNDGKVIYADMYEKWYDYSTKRWANAVLLVDGAGAKYDEGDVIKEEDIESYFVWIPRYRYQLWNVDGTSVVNSENTENGAKTIDIVFETKDVEASVGTKNGEWLTHPAFTNFDVNGIWVGKYETGFKGATSMAEAYNNGYHPEKVISKPNSYSWHNNAIVFMFKSAYEYNRVLDSHMMKNTEWGAVAYLSHSEYGINNETRINNKGYYMSGFASKTNPTCVKNVSNCNVIAYNQTAFAYAYNEEDGALASTTGNITGIYDMSGGVGEYMAAYVENGNFKYMSLSAKEFETYAKYFDVYSADSTATSYGNRILGDATGELGNFYNYSDNDGVERVHSGWYQDQATFADGTNSFFFRGGTIKDGILAGQFSFTSGNGAYAGDAGSRIVLTPQ